MNESPKFRKYYKEIFFQEEILKEITSDTILRLSEMLNKLENQNAIKIDFGKITKIKDQVGTMHFIAVPDPNTVKDFTGYITYIGNKKIIYLNEHSISEIEKIFN